MANKKKKGGNAASKPATKENNAQAPKKNANDMSKQEFEAQLKMLARDEKTEKTVVQEEVVKKSPSCAGSSDDVGLEMERFFITHDVSGRPMAAQTSSGPALIITYEPAPTPRNPHNIRPQFCDATPADAADTQLFPLMVRVGDGLMHPEHLPGRRNQQLPGGTAGVEWNTLLHEARVGCDVLWHEWVAAYKTPFEPPFTLCEGWRAQRVLEGCAFELEEFDRAFGRYNNEDDGVVKGDDEEGVILDDDDEVSLLSDVSDVSGLSDWSSVHDVDVVDNDMLEEMVEEMRTKGGWEVCLAAVGNGSGNRYGGRQRKLPRLKEKEMMNGNDDAKTPYSKVKPHNPLKLNRKEVMWISSRGTIPIPSLGADPTKEDIDEFLMGLSKVQRLLDQTKPASKPCGGRAVGRVSEDKDERDEEKGKVMVVEEGMDGTGDEWEDCDE